MGFETKRPLLPILLTLLLAAGLRLHNLATVPFGWHPDEATKALLARDLLAGKGFPAFFSAFTGREVLYVYLEAGLFALLGERIFVGRLLSAFMGLLTVALTFALGKVLFRRRVALLAAGLTAVCLWHLIASRNGYRAISQPLVQLPVLLLLFHGWKRHRGTYFLWAGLFLGLTQYTYTAVRLFPFLTVGLVTLAFVVNRSLVTGHFSRLLATAVVAFLIFIPLGWHFWQNPIDFYGRAAQISVFSPEWAGGDPTARLWQSVKETGRMFTRWGDINYRFNIAGQPVFAPAVGALFYAGLALSLYRAARNGPWPRLVYLALWLWVGVMLLPMVLSAESLPYYQRAIGILPAIFFFPALTLDALFRGLENNRWFTWSGMEWLTTAVALLLFALLSRGVYDDYFVRWHMAEQNDDDRRVAMVYVADYLRQTPSSGELYLSTQYSQHPTLSLLAPNQYEGIHWFDAAQSLPLPPAGASATYLLLAENVPQPLLLGHVPALKPSYIGHDRFERPVFTVYQWDKTIANPAAANQTPAVWSWETRFEPGDPQGLRHPLPLPVNVGRLMAFMGHDRTASVLSPGSVLELVLYWELRARSERPYTIFAHLLNAEGRVVAGFDANSYAPLFWQPGEQLLSYFPLGIAPDVPPGLYQVEIGVYHQPTGERLPIYAGAEAVADRLLLEPVEIR